LSKDHNSYVRASACDSLSIFSDLETVTVLKERLKSDKDEMVRTYASLALGDLINNTNPPTEKLVDWLLSILYNEKSEKVKITIYRALYFSGRNEVLPEIISGLRSQEYQDRIAVISILEEVYNLENAKEIEDKLTELLENEDSYAVISRIDKLFQNVKKTI